MGDWFLFKVFFQVAVMIFIGLPVAVGIVAFWLWVLGAFK